MAQKLTQRGGGGGGKRGKHRRRSTTERGEERTEERVKNKKWINKYGVSLLVGAMSPINHKGLYQG